MSLELFAVVAVYSNLACFQTGVEQVLNEYVWVGPVLHDNTLIIWEMPLINLSPKSP
jgi:hypothetical protein